MLENMRVNQLIHSQRWNKAIHTISNDNTIDFCNFLKASSKQLAFLFVISFNKLQNAIYCKNNKTSNF